MTTPPTLTTELDVLRTALATEYDVVAEIGRGGMAVVFRAVERDLGRAVALKVLPLAAASDADTVERFLDEARTAAALEHPHVVPIHRVGRAGPLPFIAMKLLPGPSLGERLATTGALPAAEVRRILVETASALGYAHERGVVHRDVKPDNILLDPDGRCVVTDFGIAKVQRSRRLTATGVAVGTPRYMSPEQARARPADGRSDLYSLGIVAYECLTGKVPFDADDPIAVLMSHVQDPPPVPELGDAEARALWPVVQKLLAKDPAKRYQSAAELLAALGAPTTVQGSAGYSASAPTVRAAVPGRGRTFQALGAVLRDAPPAARWISVAAALLLVAGASIGVARYSSARRPAQSACPANGAAGVVLSAVDTLHPGDPVPVAYELCGYAAKTPLSVTISLRATGRGLSRRAATPLTRQLGVWSTGPASRHSHRVAVPTLTPGPYRLDVSVRAPEGPVRTAAVPVRIAW